MSDEFHNANQIVVTGRMVLQKVEQDIAGHGVNDAPVRSIIPTCIAVFLDNGFELMDQIRPAFIEQLKQAFAGGPRRQKCGLILPPMINEEFKVAVDAMIRAYAALTQDKTQEGGIRSQSEGATTSGNSDLSRSESAAVVRMGKWLKVLQVTKPDGSSSYVLVGRLPVFEGTVPDDLKDLLKPGQIPKDLHLPIDSVEEAFAKLTRIELLYSGIVVQWSLRETSLNETRLRRYEALDARLKPFEAEHPEVVQEVGDLYVAIYGNELKRIGLQDLVNLMVDDLGPSTSPRRPTVWRWAVNQICSAYGVATGNFDSRDKPMKDMPAGEVTKVRFKALLRSLSRKKAKRVLGGLRPVLEYAKEEGYIRVNPAAGVKIRKLRAEVEAKAASEIAVDSVTQLQIALNLAATFRQGYFMPHVVLLYHAALRPECELLRIKPSDIQLHRKIIRLYSTKVEWRRIIHLSESAVAMLTYYWDGKELAFDGWAEFLSLMRTAQGYDVTVPKWFTPPEGSRIPYVSDTPRHTGNAHYIWWGDSVKDTYRGGHNFRTFKAYYDGLVTREEAAQLLRALPESMPVDETTRTAILNELIKYRLVADGKLPQPIKVPKFNVDRPVKQLWLPTMPDSELVDAIFKLGRMAAAKKFGTNTKWLAAICAAKRLPIPPPGRYHTTKPEDCPIPPPVTTMSNVALEAKIKELHGLQATARCLEINVEALTAYCLLNGIKTPTHRELGRWRGKLPRVKHSPQQVAVLVNRHGVAEAAKLVKVTEEHLRGYCSRHGIAVPGVRQNSSFMPRATSCRCEPRVG